MNKALVEKLAVQSLVWADTGLDDGREQIFSTTKFAELIVRECAEHVEEYQPRYLTRGQASEMADSIKKHFGVE